mmetsp:Transcript_49160/g.98936  ORF Transcript_49160/g.98936 Transcript_49160/m.98936 type:complete len:239 (-) Transcript_49160:336-1052(-)
MKTKHRWAVTHGSGSHLERKSRVLDLARGEVDVGFPQASLRRRHGDCSFIHRECEGDLSAFLAQHNSVCLPLTHQAPFAISSSRRNGRACNCRNRDFVRLALNFQFNTNRIKLIKIFKRHCTSVALESFFVAVQRKGELASINASNPCTLFTRKCVTTLPGAVHTPKSSSLRVVQTCSCDSTIKKGPYFSSFLVVHVVIFIVVVVVVIIVFLITLVAWRNSGNELNVGDPHPNIDKFV